MGSARFADRGRGDHTNQRRRTRQSDGGVSWRVSLQHGFLARCQNGWLRRRKRSSINMTIGGSDLEVEDPMPHRGGGSAVPNLMMGDLDQEPGPKRRAGERTSCSWVCLGGSKAAYSPHDPAVATCFLHDRPDAAFFGITRSGRLRHSGLVGLAWRSRVTGAVDSLASIGVAASAQTPNDEPAIRRLGIRLLAGTGRGACPLGARGRAADGPPRRFGV
jgi:hypothetical protein